MSWVRIWTAGCHGRDYADRCIVECNAVLSGRSSPTFGRNLLPLRRHLIIDICRSPKFVLNGVERGTVWVGGSCDNHHGYLVQSLRKLSEDWTLKHAVKKHRRRKRQGKCNRGGGDNVFLCSGITNKFSYLDSRTEHLCISRCKITNKCSRVLSALLFSPNYPDMIRQLTAIFRGLHILCKLLQFCLRLEWIWVMVRLVWPVATAVGHTKQTVTHTHPRRRQNWSSLQRTCNPLKMAVSCRNMSGLFDEYNEAENTLGHWLVTLHRNNVSFFRSFYCVFLIFPPFCKYTT
jgi:hypothetical protein